MTKTIAPILNLGLPLFVALLLLTACVTFRSREEILHCSAAVQLKVVGGLTDPGIRIISVDRQGYFHLEERLPGKLTEEMQTRLNKPNQQELQRFIDAILAAELKESYQLGEDSKTYTLSLFENGREIRTIRYSTGAPQEVRQLVQFLEKLSDYEE